MTTYSYDRSKTAGGADKLPLFSKNEAHVGVAQLEKMVSQHYKVVPGSLKLAKGLNQSHNGAYVNFEYQTEEGKTRRGAVSIGIDNNGSSVRAYAWIGID